MGDLTRAPLSAASWCQFWRPVDTGAAGRLTFDARPTTVGGLRQDHWPRTAISLEAVSALCPSRGPISRGRVLNLNQAPPSSLPSRCLVALRQLRHCLATGRFL